MSTHPIRTPSSWDRRDAGQAIRWSSVLQKQVARALGEHPSDVSRQVNGQRDGRVSRFFDAVRQLVRDGHADAGHLIAGAMLVAEEEAVSSLSEEEIRRRLLSALAQESLVEGEENAAQHRLSVALGEDSDDLRAALEHHDEVVRRENGHDINAIVYSRALRVVRGWRARA